MTQAFLLPSGLTAATAPKPGKRVGKFDFKLLHSDSPHDIVNKVPSDIWGGMSHVMSTLVEIGWGFIDTVQEMARELSISDGKQINRALNDVRRMKDIAYRETQSQRDFLQKCADWLYGQLADDFRKLYDTLYNTLSRKFRKPEERDLMVAVHQAVCVGYTAHLYGVHMCKVFAQYGVDYATENIYGKYYKSGVELARLYPLTLDHEFEPLEVCTLTAGIISKRLIRNDYSARLYEIFKLHKDKLFPQ